MKKFFLILFILLILAAAGGVVFLLTLNVDQYRPQIEAQLSHALGKPVRLEKVSFGWHSGVALSLQGLTVATDETFSRELIKLDSGKAELLLTPLLTHEIQISSIYLDHPVIRLVKKTNGEFEGFEKKAAVVEGENAGGAKQTSQNPAAALSFLVSEVNLEDGEIFYRDESSRTQAPIEMTVRNLDIKLKNVALNQPIEVDAKAAVFSREQNAHITGNLKVSPDTGNHLLRNVHGDFNLGALDMRELEKFVPSMSGNQAPEVSGNLSFDIATLKLDPKGIGDFSAQMNLTDAGIKLPGLRAPLERVNSKVSASSDSIKLENLSADLADGHLTGTATVNLKTPKPLTSLNLSIKNLSLDKVMEPPQDPQAPEFKGVLSAAFQGTMAGDTQPALMQTLAGDGKIQVEQGVVMNLNILREVFRKLSMIPGVVNSLQRNLPENYQEKLNARDTVIENVEIPFLAREGSLIFNKLDVRTDSFALQGGGSYSLVSGTVGAQTNLYMEPQLSKAFVSSVHELQYLVDRSSGSLMIPLNIQGRLPNIAVTPDLQYIASRLAMAKTQDLLGTMLKTPQTQSVDPVTGEPISNSSSSGLGGAADSSQAGTGKQKMPKGSQILGALLQNVLTPEPGEADSNSENADSERSRNTYY